MKFTPFVLFLFIALTSKAQSALPEGTTVPLIFTADVFAPKVKVGDPAPVIVDEDVRYNGKVVIPAKAKVRAVITTANKPAPHKGEGELRVDIYDVMAMDGSTVKLQDCWIFTTGAQNQTRKGHGAIILQGTRKNCATKN